MTAKLRMDRPAKILILGEAAAIHTRRWVGWFRERGWEVRWLSFPPVAAGVDAEVIPPRHPWRAMGIVRNVSYVRRVIDRFAPDVISALFLPDYGWLAALANRHPLAVSAWGSDVLIAPQKSPLHRWRIKSVLRRADLLFADAELLRQRMLRLGADPDRIRVFPLGVDPVWVSIGLARSPRQSAPIRLISTRRLEPLYRVDTFVRALAHLVSDWDQPFRATIIGDGSQRDALERLVRGLSLTDRVHFSGAVSEEVMREHLSGADIYVSCSESDGTSVSLLEAMASGCLPILTDLPANREWIVPEATGLLFPVGDDRALADLIRRAAADLPWRIQCRRANLAAVQSRALWPDNMMTAETHLRHLIRGSQ